MRIKFKIIAIALGMSVFPFISAFPQSDSLMQYLEIAARNNPTVLQRYAEYEAALEKVPQVGGLPDPQLEIGVFMSPMELMSGNQVADIRLMQMFPWFGTLKSSKDEMALMAKARFETFRDAKLQVFYDVQQEWYELYRVRQNIRISEKNAAILKTIERLSLSRYKYGPAGGSSSTSPGGSSPGGSSMPAQPGSQGGMGGMGGNRSGSQQSAPSTSPSSPMPQASMGGPGLAEVYQVQIESGNLENDIASLKNEEQIVMARFNNLLNRPARTAVLVPDTLVAEPLDIAYMSVSDSAFATNPMLGMLQYEEQSLDARTRMQKKMGMPMVGLGLNYSVINKSPMSTSPMNGEDMVMPMVTLTLPIYRKKYKAAQNESRLMKRATEQSYRATANALETEYYQALQMYDDAQRRMKLYENQRNLAQKSLDITIRTFSTSGSALADVLRIRQQLLDYELRLVQAVADFNKAKAWVKRIMPSPQPLNL